MTTNTAPLADSPADVIADALVDMHLNDRATPAQRDAIATATMRLRLGQVSRAGAIADRIRAELA